MNNLRRRILWTQEDAMRAGVEATGGTYNLQIKGLFVPVFNQGNNGYISSTFRFYYATIKLIINNLSLEQALRILYGNEYLGYVNDTGAYPIYSLYYGMSSSTNANNAYTVGYDLYLGKTKVVTSENNGNTSYTVFNIQDPISSNKGSLSHANYYQDCVLYMYIPLDELNLVINIRSNIYNADTGDNSLVWTLVLVASNGDGKSPLYYVPA